LLHNRAAGIVHTSLVWGPVDDPSQSLSSSMTPHAHPFVVPTSETIHIGRLCIVVGPTSIDTIHAGRLPAGSFQLRFNLPTPVFYYLVFLTSVDIPHAGLLHIGSFRPRAHVGRLQSIIDHQYHGIIKGIPPSCCSQQETNSYGLVHPLICRRKLVQLTSPSHTRSNG
jgi:hypothetical protein